MYLVFIEYVIGLILYLIKLYVVNIILVFLGFFKLLYNGCNGMEV